MLLPAQDNEVARGQPSLLHTYISSFSSATCFAAAGFDESSVPHWRELLPALRHTAAREPWDSRDARLLFRGKRTVKEREVSSWLGASPIWTSFNVPFVGKVTGAEGCSWDGRDSRPLCQGISP